MSSGKKHKHWSDRVHESVVSRNKSGQLNLVIKGGAEEIKFPYFGPVKHEKVIYHSGKIQDGEILLEVNDQSVVGLTLYDLNNLIKQARDPARFKTVKEGPTLNKDLKLYLSQRFNKDSVDHQLQAAIRDNLYLRTLPCTTRKLREGEIDGVDYTFLTVEQFQELEKSGALLESGIYEGNYYGTPKPPPVPLSSPHVRRSNSANDLPGMHPSSDGKRKRNRSNIEPQPSSNASTPNRGHLFSSSSDTEKKPLSVTTKTNSAGKEPPPVSAKPNSSHTSPKNVKPTSPTDSPEKELGSLPEGWEMAKTESGDFYFIDHIGKKTSWVDPRLEKTGRKNLEDCADDELPHGWEKVDDPQYGVYYVDHIDKKTQFENPVLEAKNKLQKNSLESPENQNDTQENNDQIDGSPTNEIPNDTEEFIFTNDPTKLKGTFNLVPIEKSSQGFGFTIVGGDDPDEFLQIKSVVPDGAAAQAGNIEQGDIIVNVNDHCVLGWTHPDVVKLFQAIPIGQIVTLKLCRGYPLMIDSQDPDTNLLTTYAINPEDRPLEEFERQLRMLNNQLENNSQGMDDSPSKSMPDISYNPNQFNMDKLALNQQNQYNMYMPRSGSMGALPAPIVMQVIIHKGDQGFGFTISDSPLGQRVKQILDSMRCRDLLESDVLLEINGTAVQNMPHNNVVQILKECPRNAAAIFVIQRGPNPHYDPNHGAHLNGGIPQQHGAPVQHMPNYRQRLKRSQTEPGLGSENGSVVSAPPSANMAAPGNIHPMNALMNEYRSKHSVPQRQEQHAPPVSNYQPYGGQSLYHNPHQPADNYIDLQVVLRREESGFGFRILGGNYQNESVTIGAIIPGGAADNEGTLRTGDELLTVDNQKVTRMGHNQVIGLMGNAARNAIVKLGIRRRVGATQIALQQQQQQHQQAKYNRPPNLSRPSSRGPVSSPPNLLQPFDIIIHRREHEGFGFVIISSVKTSGANILAPHKIGRIIEGSPAARCGHLRVGDRILAVNSHDITHLHHGQIVNLIKDSGFSIALRVLPLENDDDEKPQHQQDDYIAIELHRSKKGFGFGIRGGKEYDMPLYVLRVAHDGPAAQSGLVKVGDILVEINGHSTVDVPHSHAINLIKQGGQRVQLLLQKGNGTVPEIETNSSGSVQSLTSSAISGPESANRAAKSLQQHNGSHKAPPSPTKALLPNLNPRQQARRRANSSGEVLPSATQVAAQLRMRRAITPNPTLVPRPNSSSDEDKVNINKNMKPGEKKDFDSPGSPSHPLTTNDDVTSPTLTTDSAKTDEIMETNGDIANSGALKESNSKKKKSPKKKSKTSKSEKSKSTKVGLWLSPKNKGKDQKK